jgi:two-component system, cell cycle sensor histidine kinase and response regulator CckA
MASLDHRRSLRERLTWSTLGLMSTDPREHRAAMARGAVYLYAAGAAIALLSLALPGSEGRQLPGMFAVACGAIALGAFHLLLFDRLPVRAFMASSACSTALVTAGVFLGGESGSAYPLFYFWVVLYAFFFYSLPAAFLQFGLVCAAYGLVLAGGQAGLGPAHALVTLGTLAMAGVVVVLLKNRLGGLVAGLSASEDRFRTLVEQLPVVTYVRGLEVPGSNVYASPQVEELLGYTPEEWETDPDLLGRIIHPDDRERVLAEALHLRETGEPFRAEYRYVARDGRIVWVYDETHLVRDATGKPRGVQGFLFDVTERKQAEERFGAIVDNVPGAIFRCACDEHWTMEFISDAIEEISGYPASDFIENRVRSFASIIHPEDTETLDEAIAAQQPYEVEYRIVRPDGEVRWVYERGLGLRDPDGRVLIDGAIFDVTERRRAEKALAESEEKFRSIVETTNEWIWAEDAEFRLTYTNPAIEDILGYKPEELLGRDIHELLHEEDLKLVEGELRTWMKEGWSDLTLRWRHRDGTFRHLESNARVILGPDGEFAGWWGADRDVTERVELEDQLRQAQKMEAVGRLAGGIAHDFNNLLMAIQGYGDFALGKLDGHPARADVQEVKRAADRAASLTGQLLAFSRKQVLRPEVLDLNEVVREVDGMLRRLIGEHVDVQVALDPQLPRVRLDRGQIEQVLMNLVLNARDAMTGGGTLTVTTRRVDVSPARAERVVGLEPGPHALLVVGDTGLGMDSDTRAHAFEPFFTTKEQGKGTGLGLATVYGIVSQSGGTVVLDSAPGKGTAVSIYLPVAVETRALPTAAPDGPRPAGSETILLAEDEAVVRNLVCEILQHAGYTVLAAADGREALRLSKQHPGEIDLMVTDVVMPGMSGRDVAERLWLSRPETKVLYISGYTDVAVFDPGVLDPGSAFLQKPFSSAALAQKVREILDAPRAATAA